jgi:hypothetical protein
LDNNETHRGKTKLKNNACVIDDNFLSDEEIDYLQKTMYSWENKFSWIHVPAGNTDTGNYRAVNTKNTNNSMQFTHIAKLGKIEYSNFSKDAEKVLYKFCKKNNIEVIDIFRIKANLIPKQSDYLQTNMPHVDDVIDIIPEHTDGEHYVFLYYVNDSDGPTVIFNEKYNGEKKDIFSVKQKIKPVAGRGIFFNADQYHASSIPKKTNLRCIININLIGKKINDN